MLVEVPDIGTPGGVSQLAGSLQLPVFWAIQVNDWARAIGANADDWIATPMMAAATRRDRLRMIKLQGISRPDRVQPNEKNRGENRGSLRQSGGRPKKRAS